MKKQNLFVSVVATTCASVALADASAILDGGWRISAGAVFNAPVKADLNLNAGALRSSWFTPRSKAQSEEEAWGKASGSVDGTRTTYPTGAWIDSADAHNVYGTTWNAYLPKGTFSGSSFVVAEEAYTETVDLSATGDNRAFSDESPMPGIDIELSRNLYHNEEWKFGVDANLGFMYFFDTDIFSARGNYAQSMTKSGRYVTTVDAPADVMDDWSWNADGSYGAASYKGPGPVFNLGSIRTQRFADPSSVHWSSFEATGDYREFEILLTARPYYDFADWFRAYGTFGLVVSRGSFDLDMEVVDNGWAYRHSYDCAQWDVYGIAGLGGMFRYKDFTLGADFLARFLAKDIDVDDTYVQGSIERSKWLLKVTVGYEF